MIEVALQFAPIIHDLNKGRGTNRDEFPVLNTSKLTPAKWWDSLMTKRERVEVGGVAIHFYKMSANYHWNCIAPYADLSKSQKKIIDFVFGKIDERYNMFYLPGLLK